MKKWLALTLYNLLLLIFTCVDFTKWLIAIVKAKLSRTDDNKVKRDLAWGQKFGLFSHGVPQKQSGETRYLVHCASMGEVISAMPLLQQMLEKRQDLSIVVTTNTLTGKQQTLSMIKQADLSNRMHHTYLPIDLPWLAKGLLKKVQADKLVIMEVELWPNLILTAKSLNKPIAIINGRMTDSSCKGYQKFSWLAQPMLSALDQVFVRNTMDFDNYKSLGVEAPILTLSGNVKFDIPMPSQDLDAQWRSRLNINDRFVIVAGSTHDTEETALLQSYKNLIAEHNDLLLIIAPRHPHRFSEVSDLVAQSGLTYINASSQPQANADTQVVVLDLMGILSQVYAVADVVFVGGSIAKRGGHNPIEASAFAKPVLMGEHIYNNPEIINTLAQGGGLIKVPDQSGLQQELAKLLNNSELRHSVGKKGLATINQNSGVIARLVEQL